MAPDPTTVFTRKDFPYLLTLLFALLGWTMTRTIDRLLAAPTLAYACTPRAANTVDCSLENISLDRKYDNLVLMFRSAQGGGIRHATVEPEAPCYDSSKSEPAVDQQGNAQITIDRFDPGCTFHVVLERTSTAFVAEPLLSSADSAVRFEKKRLSTFLVSHELGALIILTIVWVLLLLLYFALWKGKVT